MVGVRMQSYNTSVNKLEGRNTGQRADEHFSHYNPEEKENQKCLPGIFRNREALTKFTVNSPSFRPQLKESKETCRQKLMQGLLYLEKIHRNAE